MTDTTRQAEFVRELSVMTSAEDVESTVSLNLPAAADQIWAFRIFYLPTGCVLTLPLADATFYR